MFSRSILMLKKCSNLFVDKGVSNPYLCRNGENSYTNDGLSLLFKIPTMQQVMVEEQSNPFFPCPCVCLCPCSCTSMLVPMPIILLDSLWALPLDYAEGVL
ncbi:hypothetical protein CEXT_812831 [Caerostris extrusa]|uniref:Uncharacterized protein n=1 Tax=Caerostris extrusa TaxID=172846 RepID=A0AAV4NF56_CAEEX|nr:hypothetical protein CEXT_812831 [Caerostris extrusa]